MVCSLHSGLELIGEVGKPIWVDICVQNWRVGSELSFDKSGMRGSATWWCKMHVHAIWF